MFYSYDMKKFIFIFFTSLLFSFLQISQINAATRTLPAMPIQEQAHLDRHTNSNTIEFNLSAGNESITVSFAISVLWGKSLIIDGDNTAGSGTNITVQVSSPGTSKYDATTIDVGSGYTATLKNLTLRGENKSISSGDTLYIIHLAHHLYQRIIQSKTEEQDSGQVYG